MSSHIKSLGLPCLLVALPKLQDPTFHQTVVLLVEHNADGAMGFVINRPAGVPLREILSHVDIDVPEHIPAWFGGPVNTSNGLVIHRYPDPDLGAESGDEGDDDLVAHIGDEISVSSSLESLQSLVDYATLNMEAGLLPGEACTLDGSPLTSWGSAGQEPLYPYRFVVGFAGWDSKQLEEEIQDGVWLQLPMDPELVFYTPWKEIWERALQKVGASVNTIVSQENHYFN